MQRSYNAFFVCLFFVFYFITQKQHRYDVSSITFQQGQANRFYQSLSSASLVVS